jgi:predicted DNA-binding protein
MRKAQFDDQVSIRLPSELVSRLEDYKNYLEYRNPGAYYSMTDIIRISITQGLPSGR